MKLDAQICCGKKNISNYLEIWKQQLKIKSKIDQIYISLIKYNNSINKSNKKNIKNMNKKVKIKNYLVKKNKSKNN